MQTNIAVALGVMSIMADPKKFDPAKAGLSRADLDAIRSDMPWLAPDRLAVRQSLDSLIWATQDALALPRFQVPAEYVAAVICSFVASVNTMTACSWLERGYTAEALAAGDDGLGTQRITRSQLFALCCQIGAHGAPIAPAYQKAVNAAIDKVQPNA